MFVQAINVVSKRVHVILEHVAGGKRLASHLRCLRLVESHVERALVQFPVEIKLNNHNDFVGGKYIELWTEVKLRVVSFSLVSLEHRISVVLNNAELFF